VRLPRLANRTPIVAAGFVSIVRTAPRGLVDPVPGILGR